MDVHHRDDVASCGRQAGRVVFHLWRKIRILEKEQPAVFADADKEPQVRELLGAIRAGATPRGSSLLDQ